MKKTKLGQYVRDKYTGFEGLVVSRTENLSGSTTISVEPGLDSDGDFRSPAWLEETRVEVIENSDPHPLGFEGR